MILEQLKSAKKVLLLGFAREGQSTYRFLRSHYPKLEIALADQKSPAELPDGFNGVTFFGDNYLNSLATDNWQLIIKSPGISPHKPEIVAAQKAGIVIASHTQIFFEACPAKIIGVTGTKGKSTTSSLIHHVLSANGIPSMLVGNIGKPALDYLPEIRRDTWVVMELSSYQLMDIQSSPHIAVLQNIFADHLDYHLDLNEYIEAKAGIFKFQAKTDYLIYNSDNAACAKLVSQYPREQHLLPYRLSDYDNSITTALLGDHNKYNIIPSQFIGNLVGLTPSQVAAAVATFVPLDTRLQHVGTAHGIRFYADTLATIPEATIAAIDALGLGVATLIAGGHDRKQNYSKLAEKIINSGINTLVLFPETGKRIWSEVQKAAVRMDTQKPQVFFAENMADAVKFALDHTVSGKICLLSPAAPSFTLFKDYRDEHEQYTAAIASQSKLS